MSVRTSTDFVETSLTLEENKKHDTEEETESDSDDEFFSGLTSANAESLRSQISAMAAGFSVQEEKRQQAEFQRIRQAFEICDVSDVKDEEVQYSIDFCKRHSMNISDMIEKEGLSFLKMMREMMKEDPGVGSRKTVLSDDKIDCGENKVEEKATNSRDEDYVPEKVLVKKRKRVRAGVKNKPLGEAKKNRATT